ncbi:MAG: outer membrane lipoprotein carrier protein LolA [Gammaproteobacteria bacterium]|nr:MAG: outer membrane lipoprotein carrier protein LolA [Gammaproteobacteria bacterium]
MQRLLFLGLLWLGALSPAVAAAPEGDGAEVPDRFLAGLRTFQAHFVETRLDREGGLVSHARGQVVIQRPGLFRWEYIAPDPQLLLADGTRLWNYDIQLAQVTVQPQRQALDGSPALLLSGRTPPSQAFVIQPLPPRDGLDWYALQPRRKDGPFVLVRLGFRVKGEDRVELRAMELVDDFGRQTRIRFEHVRINDPVDPGRFRFTPPAGVDVIGTDAREAP